MFVFDSHCDTPSQIYRLTDVGRRNQHGHVDFPRMREGGVDAAFFALYVPPRLAPEEACSYAWELLEALERAVGENRDAAAFAYSVADLEANKAAGLRSVMVAIENGSAIQGSIDRLREFYRRGVRAMTLCHSRDNDICDSCAQGATWKGLSPFGREVVVEMNRLGMLIDVSHISDASFYDVISSSSKPVIASHSCCRALSDHPRNMTDDMIRAIARSGGVIQINFYPVFLDARFAGVLSGQGASRGGAAGAQGGSAGPDGYTWMAGAQDGSAGLSIEDRADRVEAEFIADPADASKRAAWYAMMDELAALPRPSFRLIADHIDHAVSVAGIDHVGLGSDFDGISVTPARLDSIADFPVIFDELRRRGYSATDISKIAGANLLRVLSAQ